MANKLQLQLSDWQTTNCIISSITLESVYVCSCCQHMHFERMCLSSHTMDLLVTFSYCQFCLNKWPPIQVVSQSGQARKSCTRHYSAAKHLSSPTTLWLPQLLSSVSCPLSLSLSHSPSSLKLLYFRMKSYLNYIAKDDKKILFLSCWVTYFMIRGVSQNSWNVFQCGMPFILDRYWKSFSYFRWYFLNFRVTFDGLSWMPSIPLSLTWKVIRHRLPIWSRVRCRRHYRGLPGFCSALQR